MLERPGSGERALLLHIGLQRPCDDDEIQEFGALARSAGAVIVDELRARRDRPAPRLYIGEGKAEELKERVAESCAELVLVNQPLSPSQERNLERLLNTRVLDRNGLILDIFAQRAATFEGKIQVELAQLEHLSTRLVRGWTHLERQKGGIGLRGPGETQLETDRRLVNQRIRHLKSRLDKVEKQREMGRRERNRARVATVALVGYTNAGKTSVFNALTGADADARDLLFATLDPTIRKLDPGGESEILLADTVGFVRDLPHELVAAFRATLTETREADLLLHVIDVSDPHHADRERQVEEVLDGIGAASVPCIRVYNKTDKVPACAGRGLNGSSSVRHWVSAETGTGLEALTDAIRSRCLGPPLIGRLVLGPDQSRVRARLFALRAVRAERIDEYGRWTLDVELTTNRWKELCNQEGLSDDSFQQEVQVI
ncbi:MAG TPA: ribosome rescue GTPase HflX [Gammaproteobacteria bacterium]